MNLNNIDLNSLELSEIYRWPLKARIIAVVVIGIVALALMYFFIISDVRVSIRQATSNIQTHKQLFENKVQKAKNLAAYQQQKTVLEQRLQHMMDTLPERSEVPNLVEAISQRALATGLAFRTIRLRPEIFRDFYVEMPMEINIVGTYHELATFVSAIASMNRLVNVGDFSMTILPDKERKSYVYEGYDPHAVLLRMTLLASTYRTLMDGEAKDAS